MTLREMMGADEIQSIDCNGGGANHETELTDDKPFNPYSRDSDQRQKSRYHITAWSQLCMHDHFNPLEVDGYKTGEY